MRSISELEKIVTDVAPDAVNDIYSSLELLEQNDEPLQDSYQTILEIIVNDILKMKKKK